MERVFAGSPLPDETGEIESVLREWRNKALSAVLVVCATLGVGSYAATISISLRDGRMPSPLLWVYLAAPLAMIVLALVPRLDLRLRAGLFFLFLYASAAATFARGGLVGAGRLYLVILPVIATLVVGSRAGYVTALSSMIIYGTFSLLAGNGILEKWITDKTNPMSLGIWFEAGTPVFAFLILALVLLGRFSGLMVRALEARRQSHQALQSAYATLERRVEERTKELAVLNTVAATVSRSLDLNEILSNALDKTLEAMRMDVGLAFRLQEREGDPAGGPSLSLLAHRGVSHEFVRSVRSMPLHGTMFERAADAGKPIVWDNAHYPNLQVKAAEGKEEIRLGISIPLLVKGRLVGGVTLGARETRTIAPEELSLLAAIGQQVGMAVENAGLYEQAEQSAAMTERSRLARELHDSVTQSLYSVTLYAEAAAELLASGETVAAAGHLRELRDTAQEALREMRLLIYELRPPALEKSGLAAALQARLDAVEARGGTHAELQVEGNEQLPRAVQAELYGIAQEALNNALKHAHPHHVQVRLRYGGAVTSLEIDDDGVGFEPSIARLGGGFGISSMRERAQRIGATLQVDSTPGEGTKVTVLVPVDPSDHAEKESATGGREG